MAQYIDSSCGGPVWEPSLIFCVFMHWCCFESKQSPIGNDQYTCLILLKIKIDYFYLIVFQVCFQILMAASYLCLWEIDLCSIWWMQAKPYRCPNCFSCHYHDPPFFQSYNTHKHWMKKKSSEYCIMFQTCNLIWIWYFSDLCMNTNIFDMKIKNPKPLLRIFLFSATAGKRSCGDVFWGCIAFCRLTLSVCVISELSIPTPLVFKL